jgi:hypothetical protein
MKIALLTLFFAFAPGISHAGSLFGGNKIEDTFTVKSMEGKLAKLEGTAKNLKAGDLLYFPRSPFKFTITTVSGNVVTIALPEKQDLAVGSALVRKEPESVKKALETESRLKQALDD